MEMKNASKLVGALLVLTGILGVVILSADQILRESLGGQHWYGLLAFVIIDFAVAAYVLSKPSGASLTFGAVWSILRIVIQLADVATAPMSQMSYGDFANYLFNPTIITSPNPPGVPAALIDLILIMEIVVAGVAIGARHGTAKAR
jgi:hypothetical protein